jgi:hypothetical protein
MDAARRFARLKERMMDGKVEGPYTAQQNEVGYYYVTLPNGVRCYGLSSITAIGEQLNAAHTHGRSTAAAECERLRSAAQNALAGLRAIRDGVPFKFSTTGDGLIAELEQSLTPQPEGAPHE